MRHWFKLIVMFTSLSFAFPRMLLAQQTGGAFIMSSVGILQNMSNNSMAISFNSSATCLNIQNGTAVIIGERGLGVFAINCETVVRINTLGIKLYPNPVSIQTKIKFAHTPHLSEQFSITVWNADGFKISTTKATGYAIFQGVLLNTNSLLAGTYILQIESAKYIDALKFIKAN